jgi:hypothetical protein
MIVLIAGKQKQTIKKDNDFHFSSYNLSFNSEHQ